MCLRQNAGRASQVAGEMSVSNNQSQPTSETKSREKTLKEPEFFGLRTWTWVLGLEWFQAELAGWKLRINEIISKNQRRKKDLMK